MFSLAVIVVANLLVQALLVDRSKAIVEEKPEQYRKQTMGFWGRMSQRIPRTFRADLTSRELSRRMKITWLVMGGLLLITIPIDVVLGLNGLYSGQVPGWLTYL